MLDVEGDKGARPEFNGFWSWSNKEIGDSDCMLD